MERIEKIGLIVAFAFTGIMSLLEGYIGEGLALLLFATLLVYHFEQKENTPIRRVSENEL